MANVSENTNGYVTLRGGLSVPLVPLLLLLELESRGLTITREGDDMVIRPSGRLSDDDRQQLRHWKTHILALIAYDADAEGVQ
jgi:hypothetical protein